MADEAFVAEAKNIKKELSASLRSKDALIKALKVSCNSLKATIKAQNIGLGRCLSVAIRIQIICLIM